MRKATLKDIKEGNFLYMQNEPDIKSGFHYWGHVRKNDISRLKREIRRRTCLWWIKGESTKNTAARLDRFKRPDHWTQRRVEEGFAADAECFAANGRAIRGAAWNYLKERCENAEKPILKFTSRKKPYDIKPWYMNYRSSNRLTKEHKEILDSFESEDSCNKYLLDKFYNELLGPDMVTIVDAAEMLRKDDIEYLEDKLNAVEAQLLDGALESLKRMDKENRDWLSQLPETETSSDKKYCEHNLPSHICAVCNWVDEPILTEFQGKTATNDEPLECSIGYRQENGELIPDHLAVFNHEAKNFRREIMKAFEPILVPCCEFMIRAVDEFKDAFSFFWYDRHKKPEQPGYIWKTSGTKLFIDPGRPGMLTDLNCRCVAIPAPRIEYPKIKIRVIHGEDELYNEFYDVHDLVDWAEQNEIMIAYFPVDVDRMPSFADISSLYVMKPFYVGNFKEDDQPEVIHQILSRIPNHEIIYK